MEGKRLMSCSSRQVEPFYALDIDFRASTFVQSLSASYYPIISCLLTSMLNHAKCARTLMTPSRLSILQHSTARREWMPSYTSYKTLLSHPTHRSITLPFHHRFPTTKQRSLPHDAILPKRVLTPPSHPLPLPLRISPQEQQTSSIRKRVRVQLHRTPDITS